MREVLKIKIEHGSHKKKSSPRSHHPKKSQNDIRFVRTLKPSMAGTGVLVKRPWLAGVDPRAGLMELALRPSGKSSAWLVGKYTRSSASSWTVLTAVAKK